jgi:hypothetical protein
LDPSQSNRATRTERASGPTHVILGRSQRIGCTGKTRTTQQSAPRKSQREHKKLNRLRPKRGVPLYVILRPQPKDLAYHQNAECSSRSNPKLATES